MKKIETCPAAISSTFSDQWEDETFLIQVELQAVEDQTRYEALVRRLDKILEISK